MARFVSENRNTNSFLRMARLLSFLDSCANREDKIREIKMERDAGFLTNDEALELTVEFC